MEFELSLPPPPELLNQVGTIPHLADYFGLWSIYEPVFRAAVERVNLLDMSSHIRSAAAAEAVQRQASEEYDVTRDGVALFQIQGPMMKSVSSLSSGTSTIRLRQQIRAARKNNDVIAGMMVGDTPGGTAKGNRDLADEVAAFAAVKPLYYFIDDLTASAGVSVASQATKRFANNPTALYGAMGTYSVLIDAKAAADKAGVLVHVIRAGDFKGMGELGTAISEDQLADAQRIVNALNDEYLNLIARGLSMSIDQVRPLADGRIHPAATAQQMGLIDGIQSYEQTYRQLVAAAAAKGRKAPSQPQSKQTGAKMEPATLAELKQKFPKSTAEWREKQLEAGATLSDAAVAYAAFQEERAAQLQEKLEAAEKQAAGGKKPGSLGHDPLKEKPRAARAAKKDNADDEGDDDGDENCLLESGDAVADFNQAVGRLAGRNPTMQKRLGAIRQVAKSQPDLYRQYMQESNADGGKRVQRLIEEKLEI